MEHDDGRGPDDDRCDVVAKAIGGEHGDLLRDAATLVVRELMEAEVAKLTGAGRGERSAEGRRTSMGRGPGVETRVGEIELAIDWSGRRGSCRSGAEA